MATTQIDDRDSAVVYSQPASGHHWSPIGSSTSYDNTLTLTRHGGATASITFTGTSVNVYGVISPSGTGSTPSSSYTIDGGTPQIYNAVMTSGTQSQVQFFASPQLSSGQHTLVVTNLVEGAYFWLDSFLITPSSSVNTAAAVQNTPATATSASTSSPDSGSQPSTAVQTRLITSEVVVGSSTFTSVSTQITSSVVSASSTSHVSATSGSDSSHSGSGSSSGDSSSSSTAGSKIPLGPIVGGVIGGIAVLTLIIAVILFFRRRDRKFQGDEVHPWPRGPSSITPFAPPPAVPPPSMSQSSDTSYSYGRFDQRLLASGHAGAAFPSHLPPAQVTGKRQVTAPDDRSTSSARLLDTARSREEERLGGNASPFPGSTGTGHHRFNSESQQGSSNGSSIYSDVQHAYPVTYPEEMPPAYQTGPPRNAERILGELGIGSNDGPL